MQLPGTYSSGTPVTGGHAYVILPATDLVPGTSLYLILANCAILSCLFFLGFPSLYLSQENLIPWDFLRGIFFLSQSLQFNEFLGYLWFSFSIFILKCMFLSFFLNFFSWVFLNN